MDDLDTAVPDLQDDVPTGVPLRDFEPRRRPQAPAGAAAGGAVGRRLSAAREVLEFAVDKARRLRLAEVAASLTFNSVLALVPLVAVVLAVLTAFPIFAEFRDSLERELPNGLLPVPYAQTILRYLTDFAAKAAGVGAAGLVFLGLSALSMILTVDRVLNDIWQVHRRRPLVQRVLVYWAVLSVGPLLLGVSLSLSSFVISTSDARLEHWGAGARHVVGLVAPAIAAVAYSAVYYLVPNRRVAWRHALTGGVVTALTGELMSRGFAAYVLHGSMLSVYGAFAALPIFLMWIFLSWLAFLFGAAIAATLPQLRYTRFSDARRAGNRAVTALALLKLLFDARFDRTAQLRGGGALGTLSLDAMARTLRTDEEDLAKMLAKLEELGYVRKLVPAPSAPNAVLASGSAQAAGAGDPASGEWVLTCDPQVQGLAAAFHHFALDPRNTLLQRKDLDLAAWIAPVLGGAWLDRGMAQLGRAAPPGSGAT
jgi:membrane protein